MSNQFLRTEFLIGKENIEKLHNKKVAIFGLGGVGSFVLESLARAGIEKFILVDNDIVDITNLNRQIIATHKTLGKPKVEVAKQRILDINPNIDVEVHQEFFSKESAEYLDNNVDYISDCIDTVSSKLELIERANKLNVAIISCMGTGNKLDPTKFEVSDIYDTSVCPLAKIIRKKLKSLGITKLKVLYSKEKPININYEILYNETNKGNESVNKKLVPGSISFVPSVAGLIIAGEIIKDIINN